MEDRWLRLIGPGVVSLGLLAAIGANASAAGAVPPACAASSTPGPMAWAAAPPMGGTEAAVPPFELVPVLDAAGFLTGQRLVLPDPRGGEPHVITLPPESFAAGPFGRVVLVGADDGARSRVSTVDLETDCARELTRSADVIRTAALSPDGTVVFETRVDRRTRADLGVWRRPSNGTGTAVQVLAPPDADPHFGRTWSTTLAWSVDGDRLAIQSCGEVACRTRVFDPATGAASTVADPDLGVMVGLAGDRLITYRACRGLPCGLVSVGIADGRRAVLSDASGPARLTGRGAATRVIHEWRDAAGERRERSLDPAGGRPIDLGPLASLRPDEVSR